MAFLLSMRKSPATAYLRRASTRRFCSNSRLQKLARFFPSVVSVGSFFYADDRNFPHSARGGSGVLLDSSLILTSAHIVGRVVTVSEAKGEHRSLLHKSYIGSTVAETMYRQVLNTRPLAVNFGSDVAVLEVLDAIPNREGSFPCQVADSPLIEGSLLSNVCLVQDIEPGVSPLKVWVGSSRGRARAKIIRAKAPWPMDDGLGWIEYDCDDIAKKSRVHRVTGSLARATGSPLFDGEGKIAGVFSWEDRDEGAQRVLGFAVPQSAVRSALEYAQRKGSEDPIVMDRWISGHV